MPVVVAGGKGRWLRENHNGGRGLGHRKLLSVEVPTPPREAPGIRPSPPRPPVEFEAPPGFGEWGWGCGHWTDLDFQLQ
ncbi:hypothetical protein Acr_18g0002310 [Actinidia rufa]|uniref:Uncharacterized protein n=1 Tax=Actinidia rufa TaxID=165716 RepID=A0A7J0G5J9_9ERIC|nr:hypothetical protein Acr_18g0002310 [Actinidia rufa]